MLRRGVSSLFLGSEYKLETRIEVLEVSIYLDTIIIISLKKSLGIDASPKNATGNGHGPPLSIDILQPLKSCLSREG